MELNRRSFLKSTGGIVLVAALPEISVARDITCARTLNAWMHEAFDTRKGLLAPWVSDKLKDTPGYTYTTFCVGSVQEDAKKAEEALANYMYEHLKPLAEGRPVLYWRVEPTFESGAIEVECETVSEYEDGDGNPVSAEYVEDVYTSAFDNKRYTVKRTVQYQLFHRLRMRMALPSVDPVLFAEIEKPEGADPKTV